MSAIALHKVDASLGGAQLLQGASLTVEPGETVILSWRRGAGLHLVMRVVLGLTRIEAGTASTLGLDLATATGAQLRALRGQCGFVPYMGMTVSNLDVFDNVALAARFHGALAEEELQEAVRAALERHGLADLAHERPDRLTGAQRRLVAILRATLGQPRLVCLEDPFMEMAELGTYHVHGAIAPLCAAGAGVLLTTHTPRVETAFEGALMLLPGVRIVSWEGT